MINALGAAPKNSKPATIPLNNIDNSVDVNSASIKKPIANSIPQAKKLGGLTSNAKPGTVKINPKLKNFGKKKKINPKIILGILFLVLLLVGGGVGLYLTKIKQDLRQQAAVGDYCIDSSDCDSGEICANNYRCVLNSVNCSNRTSEAECSSRRCGDCGDWSYHGCVGTYPGATCGPICHLNCPGGVSSISCHEGDDGCQNCSVCGNWERCPSLTPTPTQPTRRDTATPTPPHETGTPTPTGTVLTPTPTGTVLTPTPTGTILTPTPTGTVLTPTPTGTILTPTPTGTLTPTPTGTITITNTPPPGYTPTPIPPTATLPPGAPTYTPYPTATIAYNYTPAPTTAGCNSTCTSNATCTAMNANWICFENRCRLDVNPESPYCDYPQELLETGPKEWLQFLKIGLGMIGTAALLLLLL